jgi:K+-transporting ATPase A subunit
MTTKAMNNVVNYLGGPTWQEYSQNSLAVSDKIQITSSVQFISVTTGKATMRETYVR